MMPRTPDPDFVSLANEFDLRGEYLDTRPLAGGHINDSYLLCWRGARGREDYLLQRLNTDIFSRPQDVMGNTERVIEHLARRLRAEGVTDVSRRVPTLTRTRSGAAFHRDERGRAWRMFTYLDGASPPSSHSAFPAERLGFAFGDFQRLLADLPPPRLHETIPDFHNTVLRFEELETAIRADTAGRATGVQREIDSALARRPIAGRLLDLHRAGEIPERVVHNDAKASNVLTNLDGTMLCVIDLDTTMPGLSLYDFGDMVRSMTCGADEDELNLTRVEVDMERFARLTRGYLSAARAFLNAAERDYLVFAGRLIALEQGVRFLTDYLNGDVYYKIKRPGQNLYRCRTQFKLVESIERQENQMQTTVVRLRSEVSKTATRDARYD